MQTASTNLRIVSDEPEPCIVGGIVALDEGALDDVNGGLLPAAGIVLAAGGGFALGVGAAIGVAYLVKELF
jgi:hypothetical protein